MEHAKNNLQPISLKLIIFMKMIDYNSNEVADVKAIEDIVKISLSNSVSTQQKGNITQ